MNELQKLKKERVLIKSLIRLIEKNWTKDKCKGYAPGCPNCQGQLLLGSLDDYLDIVVIQIKEIKEQNK